MGSSFPGERETVGHLVKTTFQVEHSACAQTGSRQTIRRGHIIQGVVSTQIGSARMVSMGLGRRWGQGKGSRGVHLHRDQGALGNQRRGEH